MSQRMRRGWLYLRQSYSLVQSHRRFFIFSIASSVICFLLLMLILIPIHQYEHLLIPLTKAKITDLLWLYLILAVFLFVTHLIIYFFNACIIYSALKCFEGKRINIFQALKHTVSIYWNIYLWVSYASTIGIFIFLFQNYLKKFKFMHDLLIESSWNISTYLVLPVLVAEKKSAFKSFRRSADLIYETWGLSVRRNFGYGIYIILARLLSLAPFIITLIFSREIQVITMAFVITVILYLGITVFTMSTKTILNSAIYWYTANKTIPSYYNEEIKYAFVFQEQQETS